VPALILAIVVGGSSLLAAIALVARRRSTSWAAISAGIIMAGYITVEVLILEQDPPGPTVTEVVYFVLGSLLLVLGLALRSSERGSQLRGSK
jgi:peptidoglycan/LPS O-acetylase OafA/YrhL